jgi:hypothetical protein
MIPPIFGNIAEVSNSEGRAKVKGLNCVLGAGHIMTHLGIQLFPVAYPQYEPVEDYCLRADEALACRGDFGSSRFHEVHVYLET